MKKTLAILLAGILSIGILAGCAGSASSASSTASTSTGGGETSSTPVTGEAKQGGVLILSLPGDPMGFNPNMGADEYGYYPHSNIFNALLAITRDMDIVPDLARTWEFSEDGTKLTMYLAENVNWHDGVAFSSADVKWTYDTILSENGVASTTLSAIDSVECPDDTTVVFTLKYPDVSILGSLAWFGTFIMPKHIYDGTDWTTNPANQSPIGTGPFKFNNQQSGIAISLVANEDYWGDGPYLDELIYQIVPDKETEYQAWQNGEIDVMYSSVPGIDFTKYDNDENYESNFNLHPNRAYFTFNMQDGHAFQDVRLRQAFNLALNREEIFTKGLKGNGAVAEYYISPMFPWALNADARIPATDIEKAKALLVEAGYPAGANGIHISVVADVFAGFEDTLVVSQANLKEAGIDLVINNLEYSTWADKVVEKRDFEITMLSGYQGPDVAGVAPRIKSGHYLNLASYSNPRIDELLLEGVQVFSEAERAPIYREIQAIMAEDLPLVIANEIGAKNVIPAYVKGFPLMDNAERGLLDSANMRLVWLDK